MFSHVNMQPAGVFLLAIDDGMIPCIGIALAVSVALLCRFGNNGPVPECLVFDSCRDICSVSLELVAICMPQKMFGKSSIG